MKLLNTKLVFMILMFTSSILTSCGLPLPGLSSLANLIPSGMKLNGGGNELFMTQNDFDSSTFPYRATPSAGAVTNIEGLYGQN